MAIYTFKSRGLNKIFLNLFKEATPTHPLQGLNNCFFFWNWNIDHFWVSRSYVNHNPFTWHSQILCCFWLYDYKECYHEWWHLVTHFPQYLCGIEKKKNNFSPRANYNSLLFSHVHKHMGTRVSISYMLYIYFYPSVFLYV